MNETVLITGTTSGIGHAFSQIFAEKGCHLILVARNEEKLKIQKKELQKQNQNIDYIVCDLQDVNAAEEIYEIVSENNWHVDVLINNAGFNETGLFTDTRDEQEQGMIDLHIRFTTRLTKLLLPAMIEKKHGRILNVGSTGSYIACPKDAVYSATKAYLLHFSRALHAELRGSGVSVTTLCPGSTHTEFAKKSGLEDTLLFRLFVMSPMKTAQIGYTAMMKRRDVVIAGLYNKLLVVSSRLLPYPLIASISKQML